MHTKGVRALRLQATRCVYEYDYKTTTKSSAETYINSTVTATDNLPGTGDTVIKQAVPPGGDSALHLALLKLAIAQTG